MLPCLAHRKRQIAPQGAVTQDVKDEQPAGGPAHLPQIVHICAGSISVQFLPSKHTMSSVFQVCLQKTILRLLS